MLARTCIPGHSWFEVGMRALAVAMAFLSAVVLSLFDSTSNDLLAAIPLIWAFALSFEPLRPGQNGGLTAGRAVIFSGFFAGLSVACKLSNGPLAITLPVIWVLVNDEGLKTRMWRTLMGGFATIAGYFVTYGYWGFQLWVHFGNPIFPFYDYMFAPLRQATGWVP
jgi:hypothetical protein